MTPAASAFFDFHGCSVEFSSGDPAAVKSLSSDFSCFSAPARPPLIHICASLGSIPAADLPTPLLRTAGWSVLRSRPGRRLVWYPEGALCEYDYAARRGFIRAGGAGLLRELSYLLVLSRAGEELDRRGLHRLHAGALASAGRALLFCGARGTGKTTLLIELLKDPAFALLSDDTPLADRRGTVYPFPARIGLGLDSPHLAGFQGLEHFGRRRYAPKRLLDVVKAGFRLSGPLPAGAVFLLRRAAEPRIVRAGAAAAATELAVSLAAGYGVPQLAEFFLRPAPADLVRKAGILASRLTAAAALYRRAAFFHFELCPDHGRNAEALRTFLRSGSARA